MAKLQNVQYMEHKHWKNIAAEAADDGSKGGKAAPAESTTGEGAVVGTLDSVEPLKKLTGVIGSIFLAIRNPENARRVGLMIRAWRSV